MHLDFNSYNFKTHHIYMLMCVCVFKCAETLVILAVLVAKVVGILVLFTRARTQQQQNSALKPPTARLVAVAEQLLHFCCLLQCCLRACRLFQLGEILLRHFTNGACACCLSPVNQLQVNSFAIHR